LQSIDFLITNLAQGNYASLARAITMVENELPGYDYLLRNLPTNRNTPVIGITGPPGAGKSTLVNSLLQALVSKHKVAVLSVDPSSPFNLGALLGDRIRMSEFYLHPNVFIRSLASRGALGGVCAKLIEILEVVQQANFDYIFAETVGVGQSELDIAGIANTTCVVMVPEAGDEVQTMKAGIMEIADIFIVNKADRAEADTFVRNLTSLVHDNTSEWAVPVLKCVATKHVGTAEVIEAIVKHTHFLITSDRKIQLLVDKVFHLVQAQRMRNVHRSDIGEKIRTQLSQGNFNLYGLVDSLV
jgi:LAO/AO transport system kinase